METIPAMSIVGAILIVTGIGLFLKGFTTSSTPKGERTDIALRIGGAGLIGLGLVFIIGFKTLGATLNTSLGTYIYGAIMIVVGIGLFLKGRTAPSTTQEEKLHRTLRRSGIGLVGCGLVLVIGEWAFVSSQL